MKVNKHSWWSFWLGAGLAAGAAEVVGNSFFLRFPVVVPAALFSPFLSITLNGVIYIALYAAAGLVIGTAVEALRRVFRLNPVLHRMAATVVLMSAAIYISRGAVLSAWKTVEPSSGLPKHFEVSSPWFWFAPGALLSLIVPGLLSAAGFYRNRDRSDRWLFAALLGLVAFNIWDHHAVSSGSPWWRAVIAALGAVAAGGILDSGRVQMRRLVVGASAAGAVALLSQAAYFGWPGKIFDRHLMVMIWDAQRPDRMSVYGYGKTTTSTLERWANRMVRFERAYSPANYTFASHVSILSGRYLREHHLYDGTEEDRVIYEKFETLPEELGERGYRTLMLTENPWLLQLGKGFREVVSCPTRREAPLIYLPFYRCSFLALQIFDHVSFCREWPFKKTVVRIEDRFLTGWLLRARRRGPYFLLVNWMYSHSRYHPGYVPGLALKEIPPADYDRATEYMDSLLARWIQRMERARQFHNSLIIITSDHGELLGEHTLTGHGKTLLEPVLRVPLLLFGPEVRPEVIGEPVPLVAFRDAVLALVGGSGSGPWNIPGFVSALLNHRGMVVEGSYDFEGPDDSIRWYYSVWDGRYKYIQDCYKYIKDQFPAGRGHDLSFERWRFLYDLENDPGEKHNLIDEYPKVARRMLDTISVWEKGLSPVPLPPPGEGEEGTYPPGLVEQLKALGYMR